MGRWRQGIKFFVGSGTVLVLTSLASAAGTSKFLVECHAFAARKGNPPKDYAYHFRALGYPEAVATGIDINLDQKDVVLSVDSKLSKEQEYSALHSKLSMVLRSRQPCESGKCKQVEYEPIILPGKIVVTYDKDNGVMFIKHLATLKVAVRTSGGCLFVALPATD